MAIMLSMMKAQSSKSEEIGKAHRHSDFWCHACQHKFAAKLKPGIDDIVCPRCENDFCEVITGYSKPNCFKPYQKPLKHNPRKIPKLTTQIVMQALLQLEDDVQKQQKKQIVEEDIQHLKLVVDKGIEECMICKQSIQMGSQALKCPCSHIYHIECLTEWLKYRNSCPKCRNPVLGVNS